MKKIYLLALLTILSAYNAFYLTAQTTLYPKSNGSRWGFCDANGKIVINYLYDEVLSFSQNLAPVKKDGKWGYINTEGNKEIDFLYDEAWIFSEGLAPVKKGGKWGYINKTGQTKINFQYDDAAEFSEGLAWVLKDKKIGYINENNIVKIDFKYNAAANFSQGVAPVMKDGKWGFIDKTGKELSGFLYDDAYALNANGLAPVKKDGKWGFADKTGELMIPNTYNEIPEDYETLTFGWTYANSAYEKLNIAKDPDDMARYKQHLTNATKLIRSKSYYFTKTEWETLQKYYKTLGDKENEAYAKKQIKTLKKGGNNNILNIKNFTLRLGFAPVKVLAYSITKQVPLYTEIVIKRTGFGFRYNNIAEHEDKYKFQAWRDNDKTFPRQYSGVEYSGFFKYYLENQMFIGTELRQGNYTFETTQVTLQDKNTYFKKTTIITPKLKQTDLSMIIGTQLSKKFFFAEFSYNIGAGIRNIDLGYDTDKYTGPEGTRFNIDSWSKVFISARVNIRVGINLF